MKVARDGAWNFATELSAKKQEEIPECIEIRDAAVANVAGIITNNRLSIRILLGIIRLGEIGTVSEKIRKLRDGAADEPLSAVPEMS